MNGLSIFLVWILLAGAAAIPAFAVNFEDEDLHGSSSEETKKEQAENEDDFDYQERLREEEARKHAADHGGLPPEPNAFPGGGDNPSLLMGVNNQLHETLWPPENPFDGLTPPVGMGPDKIFALFLLPERTDTEKEADQELISALEGKVVAEKVQKMKAALENGANPNVIFKASRTVLMRAIESGNVEAVKILMQHGADLSIQNDAGNTAYFYILRKKPDTWKLWLDVLLEDYGVEGFSQEDRLYEILEYAMQAEKWDLVEFLVRSHRLDINREFYSKLEYRDAHAGFWATPLEVAILNRSEEGVSLLLQLGANVNRSEESHERKAPLMVAMYKFSPEIIKLLLEAGAHTQWFSEDEVSELIYLFTSAYFGHDESLNILRHLIKAGVDVAQVDSLGRTPLMIVLSRNNHYHHYPEYWEVVQLLIDSGAPLDCLDKEGNSLLEYAVWNGHIKMVQYLLGSESFKYLLVEHAQKTLNEALLLFDGKVVDFYSQILSAMRILLDTGFNIDLKLWIKSFVGCYRRRIDAVVRCMKNNWIVEARVQNLDLSKNMFGFCKILLSDDFTPLLELIINEGIEKDDFERFCHVLKDSQFVELAKKEGVQLPNLFAHELFEVAIAAGNLEVLRLLIYLSIKENAFVDVNKRNEEGETLARMALRTGDVEFIDALCAWYPKPDLANMRYENGMTLLHIAYQNGLDDIVSYLEQKKEIRSQSFFMCDDYWRFPFECAPQVEERDFSAHPRPESDECEPPAKRQRTDSGEEADSIFKITKARKSWKR